MSEDQSDKPSLYHALRGAAEAYDLVRSQRDGSDPELRKAMNELDAISLEDAMRAADSAIVEKAHNDSTEPILDLRDTETGFVAVLDLKETEYDVDDVNVNKRDGDVEISTGEWETRLESEQAVSSVGVERNAGIVTIRAEQDEANKEEGDTTQSTDEDESSQDAAESRELTVREYLDKHDDVDAQLRDRFGDEMVSMAIEMFGDEKMSDALPKLKDMGIDM